MYVGKYVCMYVCMYVCVDIMQLIVWEDLPYVYTTNQRRTVLAVDI